MNIQTEHLENQLARLTVTIDNMRLEDAKQKAARKVANQIRIPGFRKGKVPYHILIKNGLEGEILNQAVEDLSQNLYREALLSNPQLEPYGPGAFEDFKLEENPTFIYTVPLQPDVKLGEYRAIRKEYTAPEVTEEMVDEALNRLRDQEAVTEESQEPVALGNRVTIDLHSFFADDPKPTEAKTEDVDPDADLDDEAPPKGSQFAHEHGAIIIINPENDPMLPGFVEKLIGANVGDELDFELTVPEDDPDYADIAGRKVQFNVTIEKIETVTLPELNDEFAQKVSKDDPDGELTMEQLRERMRENLTTQMMRQSKQAYVGLVIEELAEKADIVFPDAMLQDHIDDMIQSFENRLRGQGIALDMYLRVMNMTEASLREQYVQPATEDLRRVLVLREILVQEKITVTAEELNARIEEMLKPFGDNPEIRKFFDNENARMSMVNELLQERVNDRIFDIATGAELPDLNALENSDEVPTTEALSSEVATEKSQSADEEDPEATA